jgi:hypothetical protein
VVAVVNPVAYRLELLPQVHLHDVFHTGLLMSKFEESRQMCHPFFC